MFYFHFIVSYFAKRNVTKKTGCEKQLEVKYCLRVKSGSK